MMPVAHASRGLGMSDMQRCTYAIGDVEEEDRKISLTKALISLSPTSCEYNVPSRMRASGDDKEEKDREDITMHANNYSFFSSSCGNVPFCIAATCTLGRNEEDEDEEEMDCTYTDSSSASSHGNVGSSTVAAMRTTTTLGNVDDITHSGASSIMPINNKENEEEGGVEGVTSTALRCILNIMPMSKEEDEDGVGCVTPKARQHQIPELLICPPPPRKTLKKHNMNEILSSSFDARCGDSNAANPSNSCDQQYESHTFFNPPPDLHTYPNCIKALFKS